jgi:hypothetical protein
MNEVSEKDKYDILFKILQREDACRLGNATRGGLVLAANAFLFTGSGFLFSPAINLIEQNVVSRPIVVVALISFYFSIACSVWKAIRCITNPFVFDWLPITGQAKDSRGRRVLFNPSDTVRKIKTIKSATDEIAGMDISDFKHNCTAEIMFVMRIRDKQIKNLRISIRTFFLSMIMFMAYFIAILSSYSK